MSNILDFAAAQNKNNGPDPTLPNALEQLWLIAAEELDQDELAWFAQLSVGAEHRLDEQARAIRNYAELVAKSPSISREEISNMLTGFANNLDDTKIMLAISNDARDLLED